MIVDDSLPYTSDNKDKVIEHLNYRGYRLIEQLGTSRKMGTYIVQDNRESEGYFCLVRVLPLSENEQTPMLEVFQPTPIIPASAQLLGGFQVDGYSYLIRQYIHGQPLTWDIPTRQGWADTQVINLLQSVLHTLAKCHQHGVVHGNLHPNNLIRQPNGQLVLTDFSGNQGYYHQTLRRQKSGLKSNILGLLERQAYAAPEQWQGNHHPSSDIYALGLVGIQFLLGRQIWTSETQLTHLLNHLPCQPLVTILKQMVNVVPEQRFSDAQEALLALENIQQNAQSSESLASQPTKEPALASASTQPVYQAQTQTRQLPIAQIKAALQKTPSESHQLQQSISLGSLESLSSEFVTPTLASPTLVGVNTLVLNSLPLVKIPPVELPIAETTDANSELSLPVSEQPADEESEHNLLGSLRSQEVPSLESPRFKWTPVVLALTASVGGFAAYYSWIYRHQRTPTSLKTSSPPINDTGRLSVEPLPVPEAPSVVHSSPAFSQSGVRH